MSDPTPQNPVSGRQIGRYRLEGRLAMGGMAEIFLARAPDGSQVVVKRLLAMRESTRDRIKMFIHEGRVATLLDHPNIVRVFEVDLDADGSAFMAMEFLEGRDLDDICYRLAKLGDFLPVPTLLALMLDACRGLHAAHVARGPDGAPLHLVHRDISPTNLFVTTGGVLKVLDFGIARSKIQLHHTATGVVKGKPSYMSPEQIAARPVDHRSDIFSLGIVLHELLTGHRLYARESARDVMQAITEHGAPVPKREGESFPPELVDVTMRALARRPEARFDTAEAMADALAAVGDRLEATVSRPELSRFIEELFVESETPEQVSGGGTGSYLAISRWIDSSTDRVLAGDLELDAKERATADLLPSWGNDEPSSFDEDTVRAPTPRPVDAVAGQASVRRRRSLFAGIVALSVILVAIVGAAVLLDAGPSAIDAVSQPVDVTGPSGLSEPETLSGAPEPADVEPVPDDAPVVTGAVDEAAPAAEHPTASRPPRRVGKRKPARRPQKATTGRLSLSVKPWANIYYKGKLLGASPLVEHEFPAGRVELRFVNPGKKLEKTQIFTVPAGGHARSRVNLE